MSISSLFINHLKGQSGDLAQRFHQDEIHLRDRLGSESVQIKISRLLDDLKKLKEKLLQSNFLRASREWLVYIMEHSAANKS